jgi:hypothetical protein
MPREVFVCKHFPRSSTSNCFASSMTCNREHARRSPRTFCFLLESTCDASWHQRTLLESMFSLSLYVCLCLCLSLSLSLHRCVLIHASTQDPMDISITTYQQCYHIKAPPPITVIILPLLVIKGKYTHTPHATLFVSLVCSFVGLVSC